MRPTCPPRTLIASPPRASVPRWLQTNLRIGHQPGFNERMVTEYLKAGYNVVTVNCLGTWDRVGPSAGMYSPEVVAQSDAYLRKVVDTVHAAGAKSVLLHRPRAGADALSRVSRRASRLAACEARRVARRELRQHPQRIRRLALRISWLMSSRPTAPTASGSTATPRSTCTPTTTPRGRRSASSPGGADIPPDRSIRSTTRSPASTWPGTSNTSSTWPIGCAARSARRIPRAVDLCQLLGQSHLVLSGHVHGRVPGGLLRRGRRPVGRALLGRAGRRAVSAVLLRVHAGGHAAAAGHGLDPAAVARHLGRRLAARDPAPRTGRRALGRLSRVRRDRPTARSTSSCTSRTSRPAKPGGSIREPLPYVGIVASEQTRTLFAQGALPVYFSHTLGAFRAVFEKHWPVRVLTEYDLEDADLHGVRVLMLPNVACLSDRAAEVVRRYVSRGAAWSPASRPRSTTRTSQRRPDFALADVLHAHYVKTHAVAQRTENLIALARRRAPDHHSSPVIKSRQATAWLGGLGPPPETGTLALIASAVEARVDDGAQVLATLPPEPARHRPKQHAGDRRLDLSARAASSISPPAWTRRCSSIPMLTMRAAAHRCLPLGGGRRRRRRPRCVGPLILAATFRRQAEGRSHDRPPAQRPQLLRPAFDLSEAGAAARGTAKEMGISESVGTARHLAGPRGVDPAGTISASAAARRNVTRATLEPEHVELPITRVDGAAEVTVPKLLMHSMVVFE